MNNYSIKSVLRFLGLLAVLPLLVAHGIGGQTCTSNCDKPDPFILSGSADPSSAINMGESYAFHFMGESFPEYDDNSKGFLQPIDIAPRRMPYGEITAWVSVNRGASTPAGFGEMWLHNSYGGKVKFLHAAESPSFAAIDFKVNDFGGFDSDQNMTIASSSDYMLSGGTAGMGDIAFDASLEILVNDVRIFYKESNSSNAIIAPITFQAVAGDRLRIIASHADYLKRDLSPLWLFSPSGSGIKLLHGGTISRFSQTTEVMMDVQYALP